MGLIGNYLNIPIFLKKQDMCDLLVRGEFAHCVRGSTSDRKVVATEPNRNLKCNWFLDSSSWEVARKPSR